MNQEFSKKVNYKHHQRLNPQYFGYIRASDTFVLSGKVTYQKELRGTPLLRS